MVARRRKLTKTRGIRGLLRLLSIVVLSLFCSQSALAYALPFVTPEICDEECPGEEDEHSCPCPFDCVSRCADSGQRAIPPAPLDVALPGLLSVEVLPLWSERAPPAADPDEILHVPKP